MIKHTILLQDNANPRLARHGLALVNAIVVTAAFVMLSVLLTKPCSAQLVKAGQEAEIKIKIDMTHILSHLEIMRQAYGAFPPSDPAEAVAFVRKMSSHVRDAEKEVAAFDASEKALTFWLGGFSEDPTKPITGGGVRRYQFEFDADRINRDGSYRPPIDSITHGYVYKRIDGTKIELTCVGLDDVAGTADDIRLDIDMRAKKKSTP